MRGKALAHDLLEFHRTLMRVDELAPILRRDLMARFSKRVELRGILIEKRKMRIGHIRVAQPVARREAKRGKREEMHRLLDHTQASS